MIVARLNTGPFIIGLDAENVERMKAGKPVMVSLARHGGTDDVLLMYGHTLADIAEELERASGAPLPEPSTLPPEH